MSGRLRVLLLEDFLPDAELLLRELRRGGYEPDCCRVESAEGFMEEIDKGWDMVIADYSLPGFTGGQALELMKERGIDLPFILVSGSIGEDAAVVSLKRGAGDFIVKSNLSRLVPAVDRELRDAEARRARRHTEAALREHELRYRTLFDLSPIGIVVLDQASTLPITFNDLAASQLGFSREEFVRLPARDYWLEDSPGDIERRLAAILSGSPQDFEVRHRTKSGMIGHYRVIMQTIVLSGQVYLHCLHQDITAYKEAQHSLLASESRSRLQAAALDAAGDAIMITDAGGVIRWANAAFTQLSGYTLDEAIGRTPGSLLRSGKQDAPFYRGLWDTILGGHVWRGEMINRRKDGTLHPEQLSITPLVGDGGEITHFVAIKRDLSKERELERLFLQSQKLESVGLLAGGIAHDFNNLLTVINGSAELARLDVDDREALEVDLRMIADTGRRAADLTRKLLAFSSRQGYEPVDTTIPAAVESLMPMLERLIPASVRVTMQLAPDPWPIRIDPTQLEQVLLNLAINSCDAMPDGGELVIGASNVAVDAELAASRPPLQPGRYAMLQVRDSGMGMDEATVRRMFEPFFTSKEMGKGTGLGLSTVYGVIRQAGGTILVESEVHRGTTMQVFLPCLAPVTPDVAPTAPSPAVGLTVLVAEDETPVRAIACRVLAREGYTVLDAPGGAAALALAESHPGPIELLISDIVMPGMNGPELAERWHRVRPDTRVLFTSGYLADPTAQHDVTHGGAHFIHKPYAVADFLRKVREVLEERAAPPIAGSEASRPSGPPARAPTPSTRATGSG